MSWKLHHLSVCLLECLTLSCKALGREIRLLTERHPDRVEYYVFFSPMLPPSPFLDLQTQRTSHSSLTSARLPYDIWLCAGLGRGLFLEWIKVESHLNGFPSFSRNSTVLCQVLPCDVPSTLSSPRDSQDFVPHMLWPLL